MMKAIRGAFDGFFMGDPVELFCLNEPDPKAAYIKAAIDSTIGCYAVVKDGEWITRMGWWGMSDDEILDQIVRPWRADHPRTVNFWYRLEEAAVKAVETPGAIFSVGRIKFRRKGKWLHCRQEL
jgi:hypothetical protein